RERNIAFESIQSPVRGRCRFAKSQQKSFDGERLRAYRDAASGSAKNRVVQKLKRIYRRSQSLFTFDRTNLAYQLLWRRYACGRVGGASNRSRCGKKFDG